MNLLKRLKPEVLQAMNEDAEKYPHLIESIKKSLEEELISPLYLTVSVSSTICQYNKTNLDIVTLLDCFNK
jgi:hypothetical protein